jgi:hypothetical protein
MAILKGDIISRWASQMRAVLSADVVTIREPSGLKVAEITTAALPNQS